MQAIPSPLPIAPMPSFVDALTFTGAESTPLSSELISALWGASFGSSQITRDIDTGGGAGHAADHDPQEVDRVRIAPLLLVVREELPEIAEAAGAEQRIDHGVGEDVGIRVPGEAAVVLDLDPADHQPLALHESVAVVSDSDSQPHQVLASPGSATSSASSRGRPERLEPPLAALEDADPIHARGTPRNSIASS